MSTITLEHAAQRIVHEVEHMPADDVLEVYNELFPEKPAHRNDAQQDFQLLLGQIINHIHEGLEPEEVLDLWNVVFPKDRRVFYDDEEHLLCFSREENE